MPDNFKAEGITRTVSGQSHILSFDVRGVVAVGTGYEGEESVYILDYSF